MKTDLAFFDLLPNELWAIVISHLPRGSRQNFAKLKGFQELIDKISELEDKKFYQTLKCGNRMRWQRVKVQSVAMQPRLKHGAINCEDKIFIYGGASSMLQSSGLYNDLWQYTDESKYRRLNTSSSAFPSPKCNFGFTSFGKKIFVVGGRSFSTSDQPYSSMHSVFEIHSLNTENGMWHKIQTTGGTEPNFSSGIRCTMLSSSELLVVSGLVPTFFNQEMNFEENFNHRSSMQVFVMKFSDERCERGFWHQLADIQNVRGNLMPIPRVETHLVNLGNDAIFMYGGRAISNSLQDAWIMKVSRTPSYSLKWHQITIENPLAPSLPSYTFPSCLVKDLLVFVGVRTSLLKKPETKKVRQSPPQPQPQPQVKQPPEPRKIFINQERPLNTIGAMAAFSVPPVLPLPQKVIRIQQSPEPQPVVRRVAQDYPMRVYCLDLSNIFNVDDEKLKTKLSIRWLTMRRDGLFANAPELRAYSTFTRLDNGIALIGGVKRIQSEDEDADVIYESTNEVFMLKYDE